MTGDEYIKGLLARKMWEAAGKISFPAMVAVGLCIRNRVKDGNWLAALEAEVDVRNPDFQAVLTAVDGIYDGTRIDRWTNGGTQWGPSPAGAERTAVVGALEIYK